MRKLFVLLLLVSPILVSCSIPDKDATKIVSRAIERTLEQAFTFEGAFIIETSEKGGHLEHTTFDGVYTKDKDYVMRTDIQRVGFSSIIDILKVEHQTYVRSSSENEWQKTSEADLKMLGVHGRYNPIEFASRLKKISADIKTTETKGVYKLVLDKESFEQEWGLDSIASENLMSINKSPVLFVKVKPNERVIDSIVLRMEITTNIGDRELTYSVKLMDFNKEQEFPDTDKW